MPYGRPANVRSHRRGGPRKRMPVAPWIIVATVTTLVLAGVGTGFTYLLHHSCSGEIRATVVASPSIAKTLDSLSRDWADGEPAVKGKCAAVDVVEKDSSVMAQALGNAWDSKANGTPPDVWIPESSAWVRQASVYPDAEAMMPDRQPSIARTPTVLAMPRDMAIALGWPDEAKMPSWSGIIANPPNWSAKGKPWGSFKLGMTDPNTSTAGLLALMGMLDADNNGEVTPDEQSNLLRIKDIMRDYRAGSDTAQILGNLTKFDAQGPEAVLKYISAFPALEQDVLSYNRTSPKEPLAAVYPQPGSADADHPYLILDAKWSTTDRKAVAAKFLQYLRGPDGRKAFLADGFRDANRVGDPKQMGQDNGVVQTVPTLPAAVLLPESVSQTLTTWTGVTRPTNMLLVLDVSGSMNEPVPGTGKTRLQLAKKAAIDAIKAFSSDARVGLWKFSSNLDGSRDYAPVVPIGRLGDSVGGVNRQQALTNGVSNLKAGGNTGLYDTAYAARQEVLAHYQASSANLVVLLTDGKNEDPGGGMNLSQTLGKLAKVPAGKQVKVITVGYGTDVDLAALQRISHATNGITRSAQNSFNIGQVLQSAIFLAD
jgi:Ca-activated chloride channel family protein